MEGDPQEQRDSVVPFRRGAAPAGGEAPGLEEARDADLVRRIAGGDEDAFRHLYRRYAAAAYGLAVRIVKHVFLAEEIVQETFTSVWRGAGAYEPGRGSVRTWLLSSIHHRAVDGVRREEAQQRRALRVAPDPDASADFTDAVAQALDLDGERRRVRDALAGLPDEQGEVVRLMYFGGLTQSQVAGRLGLPLGTVKSRCLLAMRRLRKALVTAT